MILGKHITMMESQTVEEYSTLINKVDCEETDVKMAKNSLENAFFNVVDCDLN